MQVTLVSYTQDALDLLLFTKSTRLKLSPRAMEEVKAWPPEKKQEELNYMLGTIKSSWEFCDFVFLIQDVTRAFTHQLVRHRVGTAFAQQAQRVVDMSDFDYVTTGTIRDSDPAESSLQVVYDATMDNIHDGYQALLAAGANPQDARGVLPTNICTNIIFKANLRTLHQMAGERLCVKAQGEFQDVMRAMRDAVVAVYPWTEPMLRVHCASTGVCCFPNYSYEQCPVKAGVFNPETGRRWDNKAWEQALTKQEIQDLWETHRAEAQPKGETS
jgi:flavin-dependent thymidylate synthase